MPGQWADRPNAHTRGYGHAHRQLRASLTPEVEAGHTTCWRCNQLIEPGSPWELGHDNDRTQYRGPEHTKCNQLAGASQGGRSGERQKRPEQQHPGLLP